MQFGQGNYNGYGVKRVRNPHHGESVAEVGNQLWAISALESDALVEIASSFAEPQAQKENRGDSQEEAKDTEQRRDTLKGRLVESHRHLFSEFLAEGGEGEREEEHDGEHNSDSEEHRCCLAGGFQEQPGSNGR